ncbi:MAG: gamma-glutamylcyclotransferase [Kangiellaceae bacterium]
MSHNTIDQNKERQILSHYDEIWLFGYGSLIYKVDFPILNSQPASIKGWKRRFWQGSHDHRGTPEKPGRVATLIEAAGEQCFGMAYQVTEEEFEHLDHREKNGYLRFEVDINFTDSNPSQSKKGLVYIAPTDNEAFLGAASDLEIAQHISQSTGPSGDNSEYVYLLAKALRALGVDDPHLYSIEGYLRQLEK